MAAVPVDDGAQGLLTGGVPHLLVEDLHFDQAAVAGQLVGAGLHRGAVQELVLGVHLAAGGDGLRAAARHLTD